MKLSFKPSLFVVALASATVAHAGVFSVTTDVSGTHTSASFTSVEDAFDSLSNNGFSNINPAYTGTEAATVSLDYRGLAMSAAYPAANSTQLVLNIPKLGVTQTFQGATRDESQQLLKDYFKKNGNNILGQMSKELAASSPVDPVAGNPNSLMSQLVAQDFSNAFSDQVTNIKGNDGSSSTNNLVGIGVRASQYRQAGQTSRAYTLPLSYTFRNDLDPRRQLTFNLPITVIDSEGSKSYSFAIGGAYRFPVNDNWALAPAINLAVVGSSDLGALASVTSASLTSTYLIHRDNFDVAIGNMLGYYTTLKVKSGDYSYDPGISNTAFRNGVMFSQPISLGGRTMSIEYSLTDTQFFGDTLYIEHYDEIGISLGTNKRKGSSRSYFRSGVNYLHSSKSKGVSLNLGYWF